MASNTYVALKSTTLGSTASYVEFTSIPQGYTDLVLVCSGTAASASWITMQFNGDTGTKYSYTRLIGNGSSATSDRNANYAFAPFGTFWTSQGVSIASIQNYSNTTTYKTLISRDNNAGNRVAANVALWRDTAAITSIKIQVQDSPNFDSGSTFTLYGIAAASVGAKATGGTIYQDASYFYHVFSGNGTFTPSQSISADVLVVAGGGGGEDGCPAGGGGAGGLLGFTSQSLTATGYTVTVGAGGAHNANGGNSQFAALTAAVGGGTGRASGGSGGGGGGNCGSSTTGGAGTSGQGYAGGTGRAGSGGGGSQDGYNSGGGGGAGGLGGNSTATKGGIGGVGSTTYSAWGVATGVGQNVSGTYYLAGGGAAGIDTYRVTNNYGITAGGYGGGGNGGAVGYSATAGTIATGGGGGGDITLGQPGGSGVVIVRYAK